MIRQNKIKLYITLKGIKQQIIADSINIDKQKLSYHLNKEKEIDRDLFDKILDGLSIDENTLNDTIYIKNKNYISKEPTVVYKGLLLEDQIELLWGQNKQLKKENKELREKLSKYKFGSK